MIWDRKTLMSVLAADLLVLAGALFVLKDRYRLARTRAAEGVSQAATDPGEARKPSKGSGSETTEAEPPETPPPAPRPLSAKDRAKRNILFSYRNSKPARVEVVGSFNDWTPQPMKKGKNFTWTFSVPLEAGEYTYNLVVDGRVIRDPNNRRTAPEGRSLLIIEPSR